MLSRMKLIQPNTASLNSIWDDFVVRDNSPHINNSRYTLSIMNKLFKARIIGPELGKFRNFQTPRTLQINIGGEIYFYI